MRFLRTASITAATIASLAAPAFAYAQSFSDVPKTHPAYDAIEYLKAKGVLSGYADGTFKPNQTVKRAEAVKIIVAAKVGADQLQQLSPSSYADVPAGAWYVPYVAWAHQKMGIIDGPEKSSAFNGDRAVNKVEFLKIFLLGEGADTNSYGEIKLPLAADVTDPNAWYYPHLRYAIASSLLMIDKEGLLGPAAPLSRGDVAQYLYNYEMYKAGRRTQALLSVTESDIVNTVQAIEVNEIVQAEYASARALISARGVQASKPDIPLVKGALKTAEAFRALVRGYRAGMEGRLDETIALSKEAWNLAAKAMEFSPELNNLGGQVQAISKKMADDARATQASAGQ